MVKEELHTTKWVDTPFYPPKREMIPPMFGPKEYVRFYQISNFGWRWSNLLEDPIASCLPDVPHGSITYVD